VMTREPGDRSVRVALALSRGWRRHGRSV
jgi:hypothetical protein